MCAQFCFPCCSFPFYIPFMINSGVMHVLALTNEIMCAHFRAEAVCATDKEKC